MCKGDIDDDEARNVDKAARGAGTDAEGWCKRDGQDGGTDAVWTPATCHQDPGLRYHPINGPATPIPRDMGSPGHLTSEKTLFTWSQSQLALKTTCSIFTGCTMVQPVEILQVVFSAS